MQLIQATSVLDAEDRRQCVGFALDAVQEVAGSGTGIPLLVR
jgi:hypothetical protein